MTPIPSTRRESSTYTFNWSCVAISIKALQLVCSYHNTPHHLQHKSSALQIMAHNESGKDIKRIQIACTVCRQRKLKCRPSSEEPDAKCIRCIENGISDCQYIPVGAQNLERGSMSPADLHGGFDARSSGLAAYPTQYHHQTTHDYRTAPAWTVHNNGIPMSPSHMNAPLMNPAYAQTGPAAYASQQRPNAAYPGHPTHNVAVPQHPPNPYYPVYPPGAYICPTPQGSGQITQPHMASSQVPNPSYTAQYGATSQQGVPWSHPNTSTSDYPYYPIPGTQDNTGNYSSYQPRDGSDSGSQQ